MNYPPNKSNLIGLLALCLISFSFVGCQSLQVKNPGELGMENHAFISLWDTYNHCLIGSNTQEMQRNLKVRSVRRIVDLYSAARKNNRVYKQTYDALHDVNPFIRVAAADIIGDTGNVNSFDYLFKALEDEEQFNVRHKIVTAIDQLESRIASDFHKAEPTLMKSARILSHSA